MKYPKLVSAVSQSNFILVLFYDNGEKRFYDFSVNFSHPFYSPLRDKNLFEKFSVVGGNIEWATGQDFCPFTLYENSVLVNK